MYKSTIAILVTLALLPCPELFADEIEQCGYRRAMDGTVFTLTISRSFHQEVSFQLCEREAPESSFIRFTNGKTIRTKKLNVEEYNELYAAYEKALEYNVKDDALGMDGSNWCLETKRGFTYLKACFWTPSSDSKNRGLNGLYQLGKKLWSVEGINLDDEELY